MDEGLFKLWTLCMSRANWEPNSVRLDGVVESVKLGPGQFVTGRFRLHGEFHRWRAGYQNKHPSARTLWRWLKELEKLGYLTIKSLNKYSIVTLVSWAVEQAIDRHSTVSSKTPKIDHLEQSDITQDRDHMTTSLSNKTPKSDQQPVHGEERYKNKEGKEGASTKICGTCRREFTPRISWHTLCDSCYRPRDEKSGSGARPELMAKTCKLCGHTASNVMNDLCVWCTEKQVLR